MPKATCIGRVLLCLFLAALCTPLILVSYKLVTRNVNFSGGFVSGLLGQFIAYALVAEVAAFVFGIPSFFLYQRLNFRSWPQYVLGGVIASFLTALVLDLGDILFILDGGRTKVSAFVLNIPIFSACGGVSAFVFWFLLRYDGHDEAA